MLIIGHRGARGLAPENTIASFQTAFDAGVDGIEFDVRTTADGRVLVHHDPTILGFAVSRADFTNLRHLKPDILTLDAALEFLAGKTQLVIEVKPGSDMKAIAKVINSHTKNGLSLDAITIASFSFSILKQAKELLPEVRIAVNEAWSGVRVSHRARKLGTKYITMNQRWLWSGFIKSVAKSGYKLSAYTVNSPDRAKKWQKHGLYATITDYPDQFTS